MPKATDVMLGAQTPVFMDYPQDQIAQIALQRVRS